MAAAAALSGVLLLSAACGADEPEEQRDASLDISQLAAADVPADGTASTTGLVTKSYEAGTLPTDPYRDVNPQIRNYAWDVYVATCMVDKGQAPSPVVAYDWNDPTVMRPSSWGRARSVAEAEQYGFRMAPTSDGQTIRDAQAYIGGQSSQWRKEFEACSDKASDDPMFAKAISDDLPFSTFGQEENAALQEAMKKWRECMSPLGVPDLPEDKPGTAQSVLDRFSLSGADNPSVADTSTISSEEIQLAVAEARCTEQSGWDRLAYGMTWVARDKFVAAHQADLEARRQQIATQEQAMKTYIESHRDKVATTS